MLRSVEPAKSGPAEIRVSPFRFSPRPNQAHEIHWQEWSAAAFDQARLEDKPVLLSISAVWCHWCHVMDETALSDPEVIRLANDSYVPVRVDSDQRPDVNARYNMGGWPTVALLTPEGDVIAGYTYMDASRLLTALERGAASVGRGQADPAGQGPEGAGQAGEEGRGGHRRRRAGRFHRRRGGGGGGGRLRPRARRVRDAAQVPRGAGPGPAAPQLPGHGQRFAAGDGGADAGGDGPGRALRHRGGRLLQVLHGPGLVVAPL